LDPRLGADVARGHRHRLDPRLAAGVGDVDRILHEDHRVVVGEGDAGAAQARGGVRDLLGRGTVGEGVDLARLADVPVLAELAGQVAAGGAERQHRGAGQEMVQRLLLDWIDAVAARPAVGLEHDLAALAGAHETEAALPLEQLAGPRAEIALDAPILEAVPVLRGYRISPRYGNCDTHIP